MFTNCFDGDSIVIKVAGGIGRRRQRNKEKGRTIPNKRNSEQMKLPQINAAVSMTNYYYLTPIFMSIFLSIHYIFEVLNFYIAL